MLLYSIYCLPLNPSLSVCVLTFITEVLHLASDIQSLIIYTLPLVKETVYTMSP